MMKRGISNQ